MSRSSDEGKARKEQADKNKKAADAAKKRSNEEAAARKQQADATAKKKAADAAAAQAAAKKRSQQEAQARNQQQVANQKAAGKSGGSTSGGSVPKPSSTPQGTGDLAGLGIGNSSNLGDLFPGATAEQIDTLLTYGGYGEALRYKLGLIEADLLKLKNEADAADQRARIALDQGKLDLAKKEEADAQAIKVQQNALLEQKQKYDAQGQYADSLMKLGESPENAYRYAFARYGLQAPEGSAQMLRLPEPEAVQPLLKNPNATGQPAPVSTVAPPPGGNMASLMPTTPSQPGTPAQPGGGIVKPPTPIGPGRLGGGNPPPPMTPWWRQGQAPTGPGPSLGGQPAPLGAPGFLHATPIAAMDQQPAPQAPAAGDQAAQPASQTQQPPAFAGGGVAGAGMHPMEEGLMKHAMDMAKQGGNLLKHHFGAPAGGAGGGLGQMMPQGPPTPAPYGSGAPGLPDYAGGGLAGLAPQRPGAPISPPRNFLNSPPQIAPAPARANPGDDILSLWGRRPGGGGGPPSGGGGGVGNGGQPPGQAHQGPTNPYGMPNENQGLGNYTGPMLTLPPYLQSLFAQTGHQESGIPINAPPNWMMPHLGTPSTQSLRFLSPDEQANMQGFERDIEGKPIDTFKSDIASHAEQGTGLEIPHSFAAGGIAGLPSGTPQPTPYSAAGLPPPMQGIYPAFAGGGVAGAPMQVSQGPGIFGEAGPEAAVPLNSPGGPLAMQALAQNQQAQPDLASMMNPTSTDVGMQPSQAILPLTNIPSQRLSPGQRSEAVGQLQQALEQAGYLQMPPSANYGFYGPVTTHAVRRFQMDQGITSGQPGVWDKKSAQALRSMLQGAGSEPLGPSPYDMRGAGAPGDVTGPQAGPAAAPSGASGLGGMMPSLGL